jgi:hypothetical protein
MNIRRISTGSGRDALKEAWNLLLIQSQTRNKSAVSTFHSRGAASHRREMHVLHRSHLLSVIKNIISEFEYIRGCDILQGIHSLNSCRETNLARTLQKFHYLPNIYKRRGKKTSLPVLTTMSPE